MESVVYYEYDGNLLTAAYCEDSEGNRIFECRIENGFVVERVLFDHDVKSGYLYEYDENNNLSQLSFYYDGDSIPGDHYFYIAVEVDAERAHYIREQQKYLIPIT